MPNIVLLALRVVTVEFPDFSYGAKWKPEALHIPHGF